eukprot:scaffold208_cov89-Amphora_coffeaeformis.AAC.1
MSQCASFVGLPLRNRLNPWEDQFCLPVRPNLLDLEFYGVGPIRVPVLFIKPIGLGNVSRESYAEL